MLMLNIRFKSGLESKQKVNYLAFFNGCICYTRAINPHPAFQEQIQIPLDRMETWYLEEVEQ